MLGFFSNKNAGFIIALVCIWIKDLYIRGVAKAFQQLLNQMRHRGGTVNLKLTGLKGRKYTMDSYLRQRKIAAVNGGQSIQPEDIMQENLRAVSQAQLHL